MYHSLSAVMIVDFEQDLLPLDLIAFGRLGVTVKKEPIIASVQFLPLSSAETSQLRFAPSFPIFGQYIIRYYSLQWMGVT